MLAFALALTSLVLTTYVFVKLLSQAAALTADRELLALERPSDLATYPSVTVIIPARNEARNIEACVRSVLAFDYPHFDVIIADDASTDDTGERARRLAAESNGKVRVISSGDFAESRDGWVNGKSYVLFHAAQHATGELVLFVDADTRQHPDGLFRPIAFLRKHGLPAISCSGLYPNPGFWGEVMEGLLYTAVFLTIPLRRVFDPKDRMGWMNGQFILIDRATYLRIDGHRAIKSFLHDDFAMSRLLKKHEVRYAFMPTASLFECINYVGLREAHGGWARLLAVGTPWLEVHKPYFAFSMSVVLLTSVLPSLALLLLGLSVLPDGALFGVHASTLLYAQVTFALLICVLNRASMKLPVWRALLLPIAGVLVLAVYVNGYRLRYGAGKVQWRDRSLATDDVFDIPAA